MASVSVRTISGGTAGAVELDDSVFGVQPNVPVMHQVVTAQLAAARSGTHSTLTRAEVRGGGRKPWRQKGTGRARQGSTRSPHWAGGGVAHGPKPRDYSQRTPKKMVKLALHSALSDRQSEGRVVVIESWDIEPKTRAGAQAIRDLGLDGGVLVVVDDGDEAAVRAFRNLPDAQLLLRRELNAYDILCNDWIVFTKANLPGDTKDGVVTESTTAAIAEPEPQREAAAPVEPATDEVSDGATADDKSAGEAGSDEASQ
jgi:large subunit ribosomal protein L4